MRFSSVCAVLSVCLSAALLAWAAPASAQQPPSGARTVAITIDDLPYAGISELPATEQGRQVVRDANARMLDALRAYQAPATGFAIELGVQIAGDAGRAVLDDWVRGGMALGNHTYSHADIRALDMAGIRAEVEKGEASIVPAMARGGQPVRFVRFAMNLTGESPDKRDGIAAYLGARGYRIAPVTIDASDYVFDAAYRHALRTSDGAAAERIAQAYLAHCGATIDFFAALDRRVLGYEPPAILQIHVNPLNARLLGAVLALFKQRGYGFVTLQQAMADPAYVRPASFVAPYGPVWGYRWAQELGKNPGAEQPPGVPDWVARYAAGG
ncbi:Polysaccharide deacetylase [Pigmentiphaga humi]|uniref:Polysaccharide deacetylase n=1 Tax=Pigmentiphaga humi TaxID=2478468 RepID=A0A3P4B3A4_9BURK|nr:polysaccharide deacetylase family protein [Pigmentiphaga humi]VCU69635.1 Polysaccharide deacetylase [Pigmentiphaga humi]